MPDPASPVAHWSRRACLAGLAATLLRPAQVRAATDWPPSLALDYAIEGRRSGIALSAIGALLWQRSAQHYVAHLSSSAWLIFKRQQISRGRLGAGQLQPHRFEDHRRRIEFADFDPQRGLARYSNGSQLDWPTAGQDRVSMFFSLGAWARQAHTLGERTLSMPISDGNDWQTWSFTLMGEEPINTPSGVWPSVRVQRSDGGQRGQQTVLWLALNLSLLPVRLHITEANGDVLDQRLAAQRTLPPLTAQTNTASADA